APVSLKPSFKHVRSDSTSVVANPQTQSRIGIFKVELNGLGSGVAKCINQSLPADSVNFMPDRSPQELLLTNEGHAEIDVGFHRNFLLNTGQCLHQVRGTGVARTEILNGGAAFPDTVVHDLKDSS